MILTGREGRFSAGFDLKVFSDTPEQLAEMLTLGATLCERILAFPRPVVTACTGHGVAAGCFIQLPADLRLGADGPFQIGLNEVKIGLTMPRFVIELARSRLTPADFDRAVNSAAMYTPADAVAGGLPRPGGRRPRSCPRRPGRRRRAGRAERRGPQGDEAEVAAAGSSTRSGRRSRRSSRCSPEGGRRRRRGDRSRRCAEPTAAGVCLRRLQKGAEVRHRGGVLDEEQVSALIAPQLRAANA